jgi:hypothetical protein
MVRSLHRPFRGAGSEHCQPIFSRANRTNCPPELCRNEDRRFTLPEELKQLHVVVGRPRF